MSRIEVVTQDGPGGVLTPRGEHKGRPKAERHARMLQGFYAVGVRVRGQQHVTWVQLPKAKESWAKRHL